MASIVINNVYQGDFWTQMPENPLVNKVLNILSNTLFKYPIKKYNYSIIKYNFDLYRLYILYKNKLYIYSFNKQSGSDKIKIILNNKYIFRKKTYTKINYYRWLYKNYSFKKHINISINTYEPIIKNPKFSINNIYGYEKRLYEYDNINMLEYNIEYNVLLPKYKNSIIYIFNQEYIGNYIYINKRKNYPLDLYIHMWQFKFIQLFI